MEPAQHKYTIVAEDILQRIENGDLVPGDRLPGLRVLGKQFGCNYHTVRHAFEGLAQRGYLEMRPGSGTFVTDKAVDHLRQKASTEKILRKTDQIGVLLPLQQWGHYVTSLINQLHLSAKKKNLILNIRTVATIDIQCFSLAKEFRAQGCCAILLPWVGKEQKPADLHDFVRASELPVILPDPVHGLEDHCYRIARNNRGSAPNETMLQGRYFQALGYDKVALLASYDTAPEPLRCKTLQYIDWASRENMPNLLELVDTENGHDFDRIIDRWQPMKGELAIIAHDDELALDFMDACRRRGVSIPEDFALMGHNNNPNGLRSDPTLSTMLCPYDYIADGMLEHALAMSCGTTQQLQEQDPQSFQIRESCGGREHLGEQIDELIDSLVNDWSVQKT